jgi:tyrosine-protein kinase Etk/Wzc
VQSDSSTPAPPTESAPQYIEISLFQILLELAREKRKIAYATFGTAVAGFLLASVLPLRFTATTTFLPPQQSASASSAILAQLGSLGSLAGLGGGAALKSPNDLYVALLKSETVESAMVQRYELMKEYRVKRVSDARKALEKHTAIDGSGKDGLIRLSVEDHNAARAVELTNGYIAQYRELSAGLAVSEAAQRRAFFEQQLVAQKDKLAQAEESLKETEQTTGVIQMDSQARALIESAATLRAQIAAKEVQVQSMRTYSGDGSVDLLEAEQQLATMHAQLAKLSGNGDEDSSGLRIAKGATPQAGLEYVRKLRDVKYNETIFEILARQFEAAKLDEAKQGALIQVVDQARVPDHKSGPSRLLYLAVGLFLGFFISCTVVLVRAAKRYLYEQPEYAAKLNQLKRLALR